MLPEDAGKYVSSLMDLGYDRCGLHCWSLVRKVVKDLFGVKVPLILRVAPCGSTTIVKIFEEHPERARWREAVLPVDWAVALLSRRGSGGLIEHAGVYLNLDGGGILHTDGAHGVIFDSSFLFPRIRIWGEPTYVVPK